MFAQWADDIFRKFIAFIDISADFAYPAFFPSVCGFGFTLFLIVGVSHGLLIVHDTGLCDTADEHSVSTKIYIIFYFQRHESIDIFVQEYQSIVRVVHFLACKFIGASAGLETELFKNRERSFYRQTVYVHDTGLLDHVVRVVGLVDVDCYAVWIVGKLCNGVDDQAVVLLPSLEVTT